MREYHVEIGARNERGGFLRQSDEPILAGTNDEAMMVPSEIIRRRKATSPGSMAFLFDEQARLVQAWRSGSRQQA